MILKLQFEDELLVYVIPLVRSRDRVTQQGQTGEREVVLKRLVEEEAEIGKDDPKFLPSVAVFKFA